MPFLVQKSDFDLIKKKKRLEWETLFITIKKETYLLDNYLFNFYATTRNDFQIINTFCIL